MLNHSPTPCQQILKFIVALAFPCGLPFSFVTLLFNPNSGEANTK
jgi:hypothetical protein